MTSGQVGTEWVDITKSAVAEAILNLTRLDENHRDPQECLKDPVLWLSLASLCVLDKDHVDGLSSGEWNNGGEATASRKNDSDIKSRVFFGLNWVGFHRLRWLDSLFTSG